MKAKLVTFPPPTLVRKRKPWRCPHGLTSGVTCEACGRHVRVQNIEPIATDALPQSILGLDPDFTGDLSSAEYVKRGWRAQDD